MRTRICRGSVANRRDIASRCEANGGAGRDSVARPGAPGARGMGRTLARLRRRRLRDDRRQPRPGRGLHAGTESDPAREQLLPRPTALRRRRLQDHGRRARTHRAPPPRPARHARDPLHLPDRATALGARRRLDRGRGDRDLPRPGRVPGDADGRAARGDPAVCGNPGGALGRLPEARESGERVLSWGRGACGQSTGCPRPPHPMPPARGTDAWRR